MTQVAFQQRRANPHNAESAADCFYSDIVPKAVTLAALGIEVARWTDIDGETFDACDRIVREASSVGNLNRSHLRSGYNPPADLSILDTVRGLIDLLNGRVFVHNVPALADYRESMLRAANDIGALVCARMRANGEAPPDWATRMFKGVR